jgi:tRNA_anti-like
MKKKKVVRNILLVVLVIGAIATFYIYREYNRTHKDTADIASDFSVDAISLIKEFEANEQTSNKKYWDKIIEVDGIVKEVVKDDNGLYSIVLGDTSVMSSVRCSMDSIHNKEAVTIKKGESYSVKGICTGYNADELLGSDVILVRCAVQSKNK